MDNAVRNGVCAIVEYDYTAKEADELTLIKGAILHSIKVQPGGWWEGTLATGKAGMFPDNFVKVLEPDEKNPVVLRDKSATVNRRCKAVYSYTQNNNDELTLAVGDIIEFLGEVEEGWWRGKLGTKIGVFPSNFVAMQNDSPILANRRSTSTAAVAAAAAAMAKQKSSSREDLVSSNQFPVSNNLYPSLEKDAPILPPKPVRELCRVLYPYEPSNEDELELKEGDIISILSRELPDKGWWKGELKGKVGVFPDNFVKILSPEASPSKDSLSKPDRPPLSSTKMLSNNNKSTSVKDAFGSKDSLNDTGMIATGNVAAYRKSLENKVLDSGTGGVEKIARKSFEAKASADFRKSLENLDEKSKVVPPPVLTKKPSVPIKKSPTVGNVAGNLFSGLKTKVKTEPKDSLDGLGSSKMVSQVADNNERGIIGERMKRDGADDFDQVERGTSILQDMRAGRAKAPKRRLPTNTMLITVGSVDSDHVTYQNGNSGGGANGDLDNEMKSDSLDDDLVKPARSRNWEKQKVPWMDELKASQAKKTSPNIETRSPETNSKPHTTTSTTAAHTTENETTEKFDMSKSFSSSYVSSSSHHKKSSEMNNFDMRSNSVDVKGVAAASAVPSSTTNNDAMLRKDMHSNSMDSSNMARSMTAAIGTTKISFNTSISSATSASAAVTAGATTTNTPVAATATIDPSPNVDDPAVKIRPTSVNLRNRSISPIGRSTKSMHVSTQPVVTDQPPKLQHHHHHHNNNDLPPISGGVIAVNADNVCGRVQELELKVVKLEKLVSVQNQTIEELLRSVRDESDKVKTLKSELDKYAQCVTQV